MWHANHHDYIDIFPGYNCMQFPPQSSFLIKVVLSLARSLSARVYSLLFHCCDAGFVLTRTNEYYFPFFMNIEMEIRLKYLVQPIHMLWGCTHEMKNIDGKYNSISICICISNYVTTWMVMMIDRWYFIQRKKELVRVPLSNKITFISISIEWIELWGIEHLSIEYHMRLCVCVRVVDDVNVRTNWKKGVKYQRNNLPWME